MGLREDNVGSLENAAEKRKARLLELRKKRNLQNKASDDNGNNDDEEDSLPTPQVLFRNYKPSSDCLSDGVVDAAKPSDVEAMVEDHLTEAKRHASAMQHVELSSLAPKKVTFDLKRGIQSSLDRLECSTDRAIAELIRERLKDTTDEQADLLAAVNAGAMPHTNALEDE